MLLFLLITFWPRGSPLRAAARRPARSAPALITVRGLLRPAAVDRQRPDRGRQARRARQGRSRHRRSLDPVARAFFGSIVPGTPWLLLLVGLCSPAPRSSLTRSARLGHRGAGGRRRGLGLRRPDRWSATSSTPPTTRPAPWSPCSATSRSPRQRWWSPVRNAETGRHPWASSTRSSPGVPGFPLVVLGLVIGLGALLIAAWFSPQQPERPASSTCPAASAAPGVNGLTSAYISWLVWRAVRRGRCVLSAAAALPAPSRARLGGRWRGRRRRSCSTLTVMHDFTRSRRGVGLRRHHQGLEEPRRRRLDACAPRFTMLAGAGCIAATARAHRRHRGRRPRRRRLRPPGGHLEATSTRSCCSS